MKGAGASYRVQACCHDWLPVNWMVECVFDRADDRGAASQGALGYTSQIWLSSPVTPKVGVRSLLQILSRSGGWGAYTTARLIIKRMCNLISAKIQINNQCHVPYRRRPPVLLLTTNSIETQQNSRHHQDPIPRSSFLSRMYC